MANRPTFLAAFALHKNGADMVQAFQGLALAEKKEVDLWIVRNRGISMTWQEVVLARYIDSLDELA